MKLPYAITISILVLAAAICLPVFVFKGSPPKKPWVMSSAQFNAIQKHETKAVISSLFPRMPKGVSDSTTVVPAKNGRYQIIWYCDGGTDIRDCDGPDVEVYSKTFYPGAK